MLRCDRRLVLVFAMFLTLAGSTVMSGVKSQALESSQSLPAEFAALVPPGAKVSAPSYAETGGMAQVTFYAEKPVRYDSVKYYFEVHCFADATWKNLEPTYRQLQEQEAAKKLRQFTAGVRHYSGSGPGVEVYAPDIKSDPWGQGVTQRTEGCARGQ